MTKAFRERVIREIIVNTNTWQYRVRKFDEGYKIIRIKLCKLKQNVPFGEWEIVESL